MTVTEFLAKNVPFLAGINEAQAKAMATKAEQKRFKKGQTILFKGVSVEGLHVIAMGKVSVHIKPEKSKEWVKVAELGMALEPMPTPAGGNRVAAWSGRDGKDSDPMVFTLEYAGEKEEELEVTLAAVAARFRPGVLVGHRSGAGGVPAALLAEREPVSGLTGQTDALVLRCLPPDFGFAVLDLKTLSAIQELNELARPDREVYLHANGPELKVVCKGLPGREDIARMLSRAAVIAARLRFLARQQVR